MNKIKVINNNRKLKEEALSKAKTSIDNLNEKTKEVNKAFAIMMKGKPEVTKK